MEVNELGFTAEKMAELDSKGCQLYQQAESNPSAANYFKAGEAYDRSYESRWGDYVFAGSSWQEFIQNLGLSPKIAIESNVKKLMMESQESLVISCGCYIKALRQDSSHYFANLHLATALTAALQVEASIAYWANALKLQPRDTLRALVADSQGPNNKGVATKLVTEYLGLGQLNYTALLLEPDTRIYGEIALQVDKTLDILKSLLPERYKQVSIQVYQEQKKLAENLLKISPLLQTNIQYLNSDKSSQLQQRQSTQMQSDTQNTSSQLPRLSSQEINQHDKQNVERPKGFEIPFQNTNENLNEEVKEAKRTNSRPTAIKVICIFGFIGAPISMLLVFSPITASIASWYPLLIALSSAGGLVSFVGMWMMKKWGVYTYTSLTALGQVVLLGQGLWNPFSLVIPLIVIWIGFSNISKMS